MTSALYINLSSCNMATVIEATLVISPPTDEILNLIHTAAIDILDDVNAATDMPLTALAPRASCQEVEREFLNIHRRLVCYPQLI